MDIKIRKLTSDLVDDYVHFFDTTPHSDNVDDHKCYCVCWCNDEYEGKAFSSREKRRDCAIQYVKSNNIQGYLAYCEDEVVGWCNANTKSDCLNCCSWRLFSRRESRMEDSANKMSCSIPSSRKRGVR